MPPLALTSVFLIGLLAGVHCAGMCGGIVTALAGQGSRETASWRLQAAYNAGRLLAYATAGLLAGALGAGLLAVPGITVGQRLLTLLANGMLLALGLHLLGITTVIPSLERTGSRVWQFIRPLTLPLIPVRTTWQALLLGGLWGFVPCGLVYSVLFTSAAAGTPWAGAATMAAFGLGTLPNLLALGAGAHFLQSAGPARPWWSPARWPQIRPLVGTAITVFGTLGLLRLFQWLPASAAPWLCHVGMNP